MNYIDSNKIFFLFLFCLFIWFIMFIRCATIYHLFIQTYIHTHSFSYPWNQKKEEETKICRIHRIFFLSLLLLLFFSTIRNWQYVYCNGNKYHFVVVVVVFTVMFFFFVHLIHYLPVCVCFGYFENFNHWQHGNNFVFVLSLYLFCVHLYITGYILWMTKNKNKEKKYRNDPQKNWSNHQKFSTVNRKKSKPEKADSSILDCGFFPI